MNKVEYMTESIRNFLGYDDKVKTRQLVERRGEEPLHGKLHNSEIITDHHIPNPLQGKSSVLRFSDRY